MPGGHFSVKVDRGKVKEGVRLLLEGIGEDPGREGLAETPPRVADFFEEFFGSSDTVENLQKTFHVERYERYVLLRDVPFYSFCEHHLLPFFGRASMAYEVCQKRVLGLSKCVRLLDLCAHRLQLQERLTEELAEALAAATGSGSILVLLEAEHLCVRMRGVRAAGAVCVTRALRGSFATEAALLSDALEMVRLGRARA